MAKYDKYCFYASCTPTCACVEIHACARAHPLGTAPNFNACVEKKDKSEHAHVGVHEALRFAKKSKVRIFSSKIHTNTKV